MHEVVQLARPPKRVDPPSIAGRPPPHDLDAEAAVLSATLSNAAAVTTALNVLKPECFYSDAHARIFQAIEQLAAEKTPVDMITVAAWLRAREWLSKIGGAAYLAQLADATPAVGHVEAHAAKVLEMAERRQVIATCQRVAAEGYSDVGPWEEYKATIRPELGRLTAPRVKAVGCSIGTAMKAAFQRIDDATSGKIAGVRYGFAEVERVAGLLIRKQQTVVGGRPSMGKTQFGWQVAINVATTPPDAYGVGEAVYIASWEMPMDAMAFRGTCIEARVNTHDVEKNNISPDDLARLTQAATWMGTLPIIIDDKRCTPQELRERVLVQKELFAQGKARDHNGNLLPKCRMQLVMIDYLQKGKPPAGMPSNAPMNERIGAISNGLVEDVAKGCDVATLVLAQVNRSVEGKNVKDRRPTLADLKASGDIEQDADSVLFVHREQFYRRGECPAEYRSAAEIIGAKGRYGLPDDPVAWLGFYGGFFSEEVPRATLEWLEERRKDREAR